ncbi:MAG: hypothetical protein DRI56_00135 [Chloroflexota bacterium]|nr:MAG: hypothetical protein DRI56_00135 [Chloroflexota bacterium]
MNSGSISIILAIFLLVALYISQPFLRVGTSKDRKYESEYPRLMAERERILDAIEELNIDCELGKIAEEDYQRQKQLLLKQGAEVLRHLDKLEQNENTS